MDQMDIAEKIKHWNMIDGLISAELRRLRYAKDCAPFDSDSIGDALRYDEALEARKWLKDILFGGKNDVENSD